MIQLPYEKLLSYDATADFIDRGRANVETAWTFNLRSTVEGNILDPLIEDLSARLDIDDGDIALLTLSYHSTRPWSPSLSVLSRREKDEPTGGKLNAIVKFNNRDGSYIVGRRPDWGVAKATFLSDSNILVSLEHRPDERYLLTFQGFYATEIPRPYSLIEKAKKAQQDLIHLVH